MSSVSASGGGRSGARILGGILVVIAILAAAAGIIYLTKTAESLPSFLPGRRAHNAGHDTVKGIAAIVVAVVLFVAAGITVLRGRAKA